MRENKKKIDFDYKVGDKILILKDGILRKAESPNQKEPWTITTVHKNGTILGYTQNQIRASKCPEN